MKRSVLLLRTTVLCIAPSLGAASAHAEWDDSCAREFLFTVTRSYACQRIMNTHAIMTRTPIAIVIRLKVSPFIVSFSSRSTDRICGFINFEPRKVTTTEDKDHAMVAIRLQAAVDDAFNRADLSANQEAFALADAIMDAEALKGPSLSLQPLETVMAKFDSEMRDAIRSHSVNQPIQHSAERCTIKTGGIIVSPPIVSGPDISALRQYKDAHTDYEKFVEWLIRHAKPGEMTNSP